MAATQRIRLTDSAIARLRPREREYTVWDTHVAGLGVRVRPSGAVTFVVLRKAVTGSKRITLGSTSSRSVDDARRQCHALMASAESAIAPVTTRHVPTFRDFIAGEWHDANLLRYKPSTRRRLTRTLASQLVPEFGATPLDRITRHRVLQWFDAYSETAPGGANHALSLLAQILNFAVARGHIGVNPARGIKRNRGNTLTRFLSTDEVRRLNRMLDQHVRNRPAAMQQADIIRLLLLTGCRMSEILTLRWSEVKGDTLALADTKTGPRNVPLNAQARRIVERQPRGVSPFVFPSPRHPERPRAACPRLWDTVRGQVGIEDVRLHDLRATFASHAVMNGVPVPVVSRLLGHSNVRMTLRYAHMADSDIETSAERIGAAMVRILAHEPKGVGGTAGRRRGRSASG